MHPRHIVFCNGVSTIPKRPTLPGLEEFKKLLDEMVKASGEIPPKQPAASESLRS